MTNASSQDKKISIGQTFGLWTVIGAPILTPKGEAKWLCRCDCGTIRHVLARSLTTKTSPSRSCGCQRVINAKKAISHNLLGLTFGDLEVVKEASPRGDGNRWWTCKCSCGDLYDVPGTLLVTGRRRHCPNTAHREYAFKDITGQTFGNLTALHRLPGSKNGSVMWRCRCELCGEEVDYSYNTISYTRVQSCGCQKKRHDALLPSLIAHQDGTSIDHLRSKKVPSSSTTGVKGVYRRKDKYIAKMVFQQKQYHIGTFSSLAEAAKARELAEHRVFDATVEHYEKWKAAADADPQWAKEHPFKVEILRDADTRIYAHFPYLNSTA